MEEMGTRKALERLKDNGIVINEIVHGDNSFVDTILDVTRGQGVKGH